VHTHAAAHTPHPSRAVPAAFAAAPTPCLPLVPRRTTLTRTPHFCTFRTHTRNQALALSGVFVLGYSGIIFEEFFSFNKSGVALLTAVGMWSVRAAGAPSEAVLNASLSECLADVSQIVFFLIGAMTVVETVDAHAGFKLVTDVIGKRNRLQLLWLVGGITFCMSAVLDNLTSTIVMVSLLRKLVKDPEQRKMLGAVVVIAANAGGAWTPIGDVTTTMLWINGQITTLATMRDIFLPAAVSLLVPLALLSTDKELVEEPAAIAPRATAVPALRGAATRISLDDDERAAMGGGMGALSGSGSGSDEMGGEGDVMAPRATLVFAAGVAALVFVPVFKTATGLPPYMGMLFGLGSLWLLTDAIHYGEPDRAQLKVPEALSRIDTQGVLFFLGILLSVSSLDSAGVLKQLATFLDAHIPSIELIAVAIGFVSAVIDNVPLVAATMGMYDIADVPTDSTLWQLIAYCAGTGGSLLVIGSAAGVAFMGMENAEFMWYVKRVSPVALAGYLAGVVTYVGVHALTAQPALAALGGS
jgi:Na+/H+ antiporter NhaD/arsenite permease-like protein